MAFGLGGAGYGLTQPSWLPARVLRASEPRPKRARSRREPSGGSRSRAACGRPSVSRSSPCWLSAVRQRVRLCPRAQQPPTGAHAALPRCSRELPAPLAQPPERRRRDGWPSPPRRDRSRDRRARCPARESPACGRTRRSWRARRSSRGLRRRAPVFRRGHARGRLHRLGDEVPRSGHPPRRRRRHGKLDPCARG